MGSLGPARTFLLFLVGLQENRKKWSQSRQRAARLNLDSICRLSRRFHPRDRFYPTTGGLFVMKSFVFSPIGFALLSTLVLLLPRQAAQASPPSPTGSDREQARVLEIVGQPTSLTVEPKQVILDGPRARTQLLITGHYAEGQTRDLTSFATIACATQGLVRIAGTYLNGQQNGSSTLTIQAGTQTTSVPLIVRGLERDEPVSFRHELIAALNVGGCNAGACHGTPSGKNGFRLSLRGYDPAQDYLQLTRDIFARRTTRLHPEASLMYLKALGRVPHGGGVRFGVSTLGARTIHTWLQQGLRDDPKDLPALDSITILPDSRVQQAPARWQQLKVLARFGDGAIRDVTRLTVFSSSDDGVASVDRTGLVEFEGPGEVAILCRYLMHMETVHLTYLEPRDDFVWPNPPEHNYVDHHVFAKLHMLSIPPSDLCSDADFLRRAYLDLCGILPSAEEVRTFLNSKEANKRDKLIDTLLQRPEYADFWTLKWSDVLRSSRKSIQVKGTQLMQQWLRGHLIQNTGFDVVVRELLTASGSTFSHAPANYYRIARNPEDLAETTAQLFFGVRMQCAKCHNHPFEKWTQDDYYSLAAFFARVQRKPDPRQPGPNPKKKDGGEIIYVARSGEVTQPRTGKVMAPRFLGGAQAKVPPGSDRRQALAAWVTSADNEFFARSVVNRVWYHLMGKGIVDPVDDFRDSNPAANEELLDALASDFVAHHFDLRHLIRTIMRSRTYQLSAEANELNEADEKYFSHAVTKLLPAEPLLDALCQVTEIPEKFAGLPLGTRAVQLPDGEVNHPFLKTFGQPARELACECERESDSNLAQALQLINGPTVNGKLRDPKNRIGRLLASKAADQAILEELYLATLSRYPMPEEVQAISAHVRDAKDKRRAWEDVLWALINTKEFLFRH
jgi:hypothetical protein